MLLELGDDGHDCPGASHDDEQIDAPDNRANAGQSAAEWWTTVVAYRSAVDGTTTDASKSLVCNDGRAPIEHVEADMPLRLVSASRVILSKSVTDWSMPAAGLSTLAGGTLWRSRDK